MNKKQYHQGVNELIEYGLMEKKGNEYSIKSDFAKEITACMNEIINYPNKFKKIDLITTAVMLALIRRFGIIDEKKLDIFTELMTAHVDVLRRNYEINKSMQ